jgi:hypothetical protein
VSEQRAIATSGTAVQKQASCGMADRGIRCDGRIVKSIFNGIGDHGRSFSHLSHWKYDIRNGIAYHEDFSAVGG